MFSLFKKKVEPQELPQVAPTEGASPATAASPLAPPASAASAANAAAPQPEPAKASWKERLQAGLSRTSKNLAGMFGSIKVDDAYFEELETALLMADVGMEAATYLIEALKLEAKRERIEDGETLKRALAKLMTELLTPLQVPLNLHAAQPLVVMVAGVNGAGKTTSIGKLAKYFQAQGKTVLLAAGDTFRAAAREQLAVWGERNGVTVVQQESADPAAVVFDAIQSAKAKGINIVIADTAGRLPTQLHLMEELKKVKRVAGKVDLSPHAAPPHEVLLVLDGTTGQNAVMQLNAFHEAIGVTGIVMTKLDGSAKGGVVATIANLHRRANNEWVGGAKPVALYFIGVGEGMDDLQPFVASEFVDALLGL
jgi:fused signal recognition particle receptor